MVPAVFVFSVATNLGDGGSTADGTRAAAAARVTREGALERMAACRVAVVLRVAIVVLEKKKRVASKRTRRDHVDDTRQIYYNNYISPFHNILQTVPLLA